MLWVTTLIPKVLPAVAKHWLPIVLVGLLTGQQVQLWQSRRDNRALTATINVQKDELAEVRGALQKMTAAVASLKPGETTTITVPVPGPVRVVTQIKEVPVIVTRTEKTVETKVETVTLPPERIREIIDRAPQSLVFELTATRDIKMGEKFRVVASQIQPGIWQPILEIGAPITADVRTVTPTERIPQPPAPAARLEGRLLAGYDGFDRWIAGVRLTQPVGARWAVEGEARYRFATRDVRWSLVATWRPF